MQSQHLWLSFGVQALLPEDAAPLVACCQENHWQALAEHDEHHDLASGSFTEPLLYPQNIVANEQEYSAQTVLSSTDFIQVNAWQPVHGGTGITMLAQRQMM